MNLNSARHLLSQNIARLDESEMNGNFYMRAKKENS